MLAGDSLVMMAQDTSNFEQHLEAFEDISDNHRIIQEATEKVLLDSEYDGREQTSPSPSPLPHPDRRLSDQVVVET